MKKESISVCVLKDICLYLEEVSSIFGLPFFVIKYLCRGMRGYEERFVFSKL